MSEIKKIFSQRFSELRSKAGLSQLQIAEMLSKKQATISKWEVGLSEPPLDDLKQLTTILSCSADYLLGISSISAADLPPWFMPLYPKLVKLKAPARESVRALLRGLEENDS
jgi:transcriptional regulator with XRE-family HTH domain